MSTAKKERTRVGEILGFLGLEFVCIKLVMRKVLWMMDEEVDVTWGIFTA
jgi:hypothetical protein